MAGPLDIQRPARGLVDLLGLRATGDSPHQMADAVSGVLDLLDMYLIDRRTSTMTLTSAAVSANGILNFNALPALQPLPPGQAIAVYSVALEYTVAAAATWSGAVLVRRAVFESLQGHTWCCGTDPGAVIGGAAAITITLGAYFARPLLLLPGDQFALWTKNFTGVGSFGSLYVDYARVSL